MLECVVGSISNGDTVVVSPTSDLWESIQTKVLFGAESENGKEPR